jgi:DNA-binding CsgD family transcriptional regulator
MRISLEEFSTVIAAIHAAAAFPERWPDAVSAVARLMSASAEKPSRDNGERNWESMLRLNGPADVSPLARQYEPSLKRVVALLAPHVKTAKQVQMRLAEAQPGRLALASLDRLAIAALVVSGSGVVHHLNAWARALLAEAGCLRVVKSRLRFDKVALSTAFEAALRSATQNPARSSLLPLSSTEEAYEVAVSPLQGNHGRLLASPVPLALVVIARSRPDAARIAQRVRCLYGLTQAEARVMAALTLGATVDEIAAAHGVRTSTVRAQVRGIFEKTGVRRQSDLVRLALTGAPLLSSPDH